jgi:hypothetical protein
MYTGGVLIAAAARGCAGAGASASDPSMDAQAATETTRASRGRRSGIQEKLI